MRKGLWLAALLVSLSGLAGQAGAETLRVAVGQRGFWDTSIAVWGDRAGFFQKEGLTLELLYTDGGAETQQAVISGSVEIGIGAGTLGVLGAAVRGAPLRAFAAEWHGASDLFWYGRAADPARSLADAAGKTAGFSTVGSSSHLVLLSLLEAAGVRGTQSGAQSGARPTPTGGAGATLTQVMSGQIDIGWSVVPIGLKEEQAGQIRILARGADLPALAEQTTRLNIVNAAYLTAHRDVIQRFARAYQASLDWAYAEPQAVAWFAEGLQIDPALARRSRDSFYLKSAMQPDIVKGLDLTLKQAIDLKRVPPGTTLEQARTMLDLVPAAAP